MRTLLALLLLTGTASAHVTLTSPKPRTLANKAPPCGAASSTRGTNVTEFGPGETITVEWDETVDHPGHYRIAFDDDGDDVFQNPNNPNDNFPFTLMEPIADKSGGHYTQQITLPTTLCTNCTLQLMQIMTVQVPYNSFYYQCADISIVEGGGSGSGSDTPPADSGGCAIGSRSGSGGLAGLIVLVGLVARRKRR